MPKIENRSEYLYVTPNEPYSAENYRSAVREVFAVCTQHGHTKILADIRSIDRQIPVIEKFELGIFLAQILGSRIELAILAPAPMIDKMGENAAVNRGGRILVTHDLEEALRWLRVSETN